jgi:hypothetical protein
VLRRSLDQALPPEMRASALCHNLSSASALACSTADAEPLFASRRPSAGVETDATPRGLEEGMARRPVIDVADGCENSDLSALSADSQVDSSAVISQECGQPEVLNATGPPMDVSEGGNHTVLTVSNANSSCRKCINKLSMLFSTEGHVFLVDPGFRPKLSSRGSEAPSDYGICDAV